MPGQCPQPAPRKRFSPPAPRGEALRGELVTDLSRACFFKHRPRVRMGQRKHTSAERTSSSPPRALPAPAWRWLRPSGAARRDRGVRAAAVPGARRGDACARHNESERPIFLPGNAKRWRRLRGVCARRGARQSRGSSARPGLAAPPSRQLPLLPKSRRVVYGWRHACACVRVTRVRAAERGDEGVKLHHRDTAPGRGGAGAGARPGTHTASRSPDAPRPALAPAGRGLRAL